MMFFYTVCLVVGLMFTLVSAVAGHFFGGHEAGHLGTGGHAEAGFDDSGVPGISFFSPLVLACFITAFGGFGIVFSGIQAATKRLVECPVVGGRRVLHRPLRAVAVQPCFQQVPGFQRIARGIAGRAKAATLIRPIPTRRCRRNRLCPGRHPLHRAGALRKPNGDSARTNGEDHARRWHPILC